MCVTFLESSKTAIDRRCQRKFSVKLQAVCNLVQYLSRGRTSRIRSLKSPQKVHVICRIVSNDFLRAGREKWSEKTCSLKLMQLKCVLSVSHYVLLLLPGTVPIITVSFALVTSPPTSCRITARTSYLTP